MKTIFPTVFQIELNTLRLKKLEFKKKLMT